MSCLVLDVRLPGLNGLDFQTELARVQIDIPIIFITGHGDIPMSVKAMKAGAVEFLTKPFREQELLDAVRVALDRDRKRREHDKMTGTICVSTSIRSVLARGGDDLLAAGMMNKQVAAEIGVTEVTVKVHQAKIMRKLDAKSFADLVRMADALGLPHIRMDLETGEVRLLANQILLRQVDAATGHKPEARSGLSLKNTPATGDTPTRPYRRRLVRIRFQQAMSPSRRLRPSEKYIIGAAGAPMRIRAKQKARWLVPRASISAAELLVAGVISTSSWSCVSNGL